jgi:hypothetical protein
MISAILIALVLSVVLAWVVASARPEHRPISILLSIGLADELAERSVAIAVLDPLRFDAQWASAARLLTDAVTLVWPAAILATALVVYVGRKPWAAIAGWAMVVGILGAMHHVVADHAHEHALALAHASAVAGAAAMGVAWYRRTKTRATTSQHALAFVIAAEVVSLFGAWRIGVVDGWLVSQVLYLIMFGALIALQGRLVWDSSRSQHASA